MNEASELIPPATLRLCAIDSETEPALESRILSSPVSLMARRAMTQNSCSILTTTSLIMVAILKSPPPCRGSANDSSSRTLASNFAKSYLDGKVGSTGMAMPFSSTDTASGNMNSNGAKRRFLHSLRNADWSASNPVDDPSAAAVSPCSAVHSAEEKTANVEDDEAEGAPAVPPGAPRAASPEEDASAAASTCVQASALAPKTPPPAASSARLK
mmetsp:Transcript_34656/g.73102  ORF Transcript_34656/g.73102 Transcript_34656/m.73102 type:complete len:214 (-) Transcript_34656:1326-1967(-)